MDLVLHALAEQRRRDILTLVWHDEMTAGDIAAHFDVSRPAVSQHLAILRDAELVAVRPLGTRRFYRARPETIAAVRDYLDAFWDNSLERLKRAVEGTAHGNG